MKIEAFEDLDCWKASRELVKMVFEVSKTGILAKDFETRSQLRRAALSAMNNIAEGFARISERDSLRFYDISQSSAAEVKSMTYLLSDLDYLPPEQVSALTAKAVSTRNLTLGLIRYMRNRKR